MENCSLENKTFVVLGGTGTVGSGAALAALHKQATVVITSRKLSKAEDMRTTLLKFCPEGKTRLFVSGESILLAVTILCIHFLLYFRGKL